MAAEKPRAPRAIDNLEVKDEPDDHHRSSTTRRSFIKGVALTGGALAFGGSASFRSGALAAPASTLPNPTDSGITHIVVVMMENRSFDHFLGWLPGATGRQAGLTYYDSFGIPHNTYPLAPDYQGCGHPDPDHSYAGARVEYDGGKCDGWLRAGTNDVFSIGYYTRKDLAFLGKAARDWTACDQYFAAIAAPTFPNRIYQPAAQTDRLSNSPQLCTLPTIWDQLNRPGGPTGLYYYNDAPVLGLWGSKYIGISRPYPQFLADCAAGTLPDVSFVDPRLAAALLALSNDDHPHSDIRNGEAFLNQLYTAVTSSPAWPNTVLIINFDEWGGFFEHVPPQYAPIPAADQAAGSDGLRGFRVPCLVISPFSRRETVAHNLYDHTSILKMIEWRWSLNPLTVRDQSANNIAEVLNFQNPDTKAPAYSVPPGPFSVPCPDQGDFNALIPLFQSYGWPL